jgi:hypothetical protein
MSCCGGHRAAQRPSYPASPVPVRQRAPMRAKSVAFEYHGTGAIAVTGPATGATYRFSGNGARLSVHGSDAPSLVSVPGLKPVR